MKNKENNNPKTKQNSPDRSMKVTTNDTEVDDQTQQRLKEKELHNEALQNEVLSKEQ